MRDVEQRSIQTNGIQMRIAEAGEGPLVVLCHGFPESWYSWRHQLPALAAAGYHAVAPDMRGYGGTDRPDPIEAYTVMHLVGDMVGLLDACGEQQAVIVGHDWGSIVAWNAALIRPDRFRAVVGMSVPYFPRLPMRPTELFKAAAGDSFMYILYFQDPGKAEAELDPRARETMRKILYSGSGSAPVEGIRRDLPRTAGFLDGMREPDKLPAWLREEDLDFYAAEFERTGFRGGINWYRNFDRNWETAPRVGAAKIEIPCLMVTAEWDPVLRPEMAAGMPDLIPDLETASIPRCGHWTQQEKPEELNRILVDWLQRRFC